MWIEEGDIYNVDEENKASTFVLSGLNLTWSLYPTKMLRASVLFLYAQTSVFV